MSDLVGNPEDRFSRVAAHILPAEVLEVVIITSGCFFPISCITICSNCAISESVNDP